MQQSSEQSKSNSSSLLVIGVIISAVAVGTAYYLLKEEEKVIEPIPALVQPEVIVEQPVPVVEENISEPAPVVEEIIEEPEIAEVIVEPEEEVNPLPELNESDSWVKEKLAALTWRKELLRLVIDDDMIRRLVVFTDNFAQGLIAYEHSLLIKPSTKFDAIPIEAAKEQQWAWDDNTSKRFNLYVEFLRAFDVEKLVDMYFELKPLIDDAYEELGYPDDDFTDTMQDAIARVLDMDIPKEEIILVRPSVMYKYQDQDLEDLPDTDKLLLRLGKENLLVIKSVLLEFSDKLGRRRS